MGGSDRADDRRHHPLRHRIDGSVHREGALNCIRFIEQIDAVHPIQEMMREITKQGDITTADGEAARRFSELLRVEMERDDSGETIWDGPHAPDFGSTRTGRTNLKDGGPTANHPKGSDLTE